MRYPTHTEGHIVSPYELGYTVPSQLQIDKRKTTNHHGWYNSAWYQDKRYRQVFRNLTSHVYPMLRNEHNDGDYTLHDKYSPPVMPKDAKMIEVVDDYLAVNGVIECVREKKTSEVYEMQADEWQLIKGLYKKAVR